LLGNRENGPELQHPATSSDATANAIVRVINLMLPRCVRMPLARPETAAGIPKRDERNRVVDIHALRVTFGTHLCAAGVPLRTAQAAMRHSKPELTANVYTDPKLLDVAGVIQALPDLAFPPEAATTATLVVGA
jgi:hypothetical protein